MAKARAVFHKELGDQLIEWREGKGWSVQQAVNAARAKGFRLTPQAIRGVETGQTRNPDRQTLEGLAAAYGLDYMELVGRFVERNYGIGIEALSMLPIQPRADIAPGVLAALTDPLVAAEVHTFLSIDPQFREWICTGPFDASPALSRARGSSHAQSAAKRTKRAREPRR